MSGRYEDGILIKSFHYSIGTKNHTTRKEMNSLPIMAQLRRSIDKVEETFKRAEWQPSLFAGAQVLEQLAHNYILNAFFVDLGIDLPLGSTCTHSALMSKYKLEARHHKLIGVCLDLLQMDGILTRDCPGTWTVVGPPPSETDILNQLKQLQTNLIQFPECKAEGLLLTHLGPQLGACWTGKASGLALMFPPEDSWNHKFGVTEFYQNSKIHQHTKMNYIEEMVAQVADSRQEIRILEIGAGTGSITLRVLEKLTKANKAKVCYTFTDISTFFTRKAKPRFETLFPTVDFEFRVLDIERDPAEQGFGEHENDVVIAGDVLHATRNLHDSVAHTRQLLRNGGGGVLILAEIFEMAKFFSCTFGLTDGWWRYADDRRDGPVMTPEEWTRLLELHGFVNSLHVWDCAQSGQGSAAQGLVVAQTN